MFARSFARRRETLNRYGMEALSGNGFAVGRLRSQQALPVGVGVERRAPLVDAGGVADSHYSVQRHGVRPAPGLPSSPSAVPPSGPRGSPPIPTRTATGPAMPGWAGDTGHSRAGASRQAMPARSVREEEMAARASVTSAATANHASLDRTRPLPSAAVGQTCTRQMRTL